jgi:hypothetical protein
MLGVIDARIPGVELDRADLHEAKKALDIIDPKACAFAAFALLIFSWCTLSGTGGRFPL